MKCKTNCGQNTQYGNEYCEKCMDEMIKQEVELIRYKNSKPTFHIDSKARGRNKRMLETFGEQLKEQLGWQEVKT